MVERQFSKLWAGVRFSHPAPNSKKPPYGGFLFKNKDFPLFNSVLQGFCSAELWNAHCWNADACAGARVASLACCASLCGKDAETGDRNFLTFLESVDDAVDHCVYNLFCLDFCTAQFSMNCVYE